jgi:hypothetical protein
MGMDARTRLGLVRVYEQLGDAGWGVLRGNMRLRASILAGFHRGLVVSHCDDLYRQLLA